MNALRAFVPWLTLALILALTALAYWPGLQGSFLFDDYANLPSLGAHGPVNEWPTFWRYITSGTADPTGRPIALLSFLVDAHDWPADPLPFKRTNLILHLLNGLLLFSLLKSLASALPVSDRFARSRASMAATLGAALWLVHPLFVSTTLYIVQREAMLPVLFTLLGLLFWLRGRRAFGKDKAVTGTLWAIGGLGGCTLLAVLSKANGVLLPALALAVEFAFLRPLAPVRASQKAAGLTYRRVMLVLAGIPSALVIAYLLDKGWRGLIHGGPATRPWTLAQRLLTEPRILVDYLGLLWLPRPFTPGLFNDHIRVSTSLWSPLVTLPSLLAVAALIGTGIALRKRLPAVALAILFFFVGQSIESSTVSLELYFEHRNYLPALLMFWPLALWLCDVPQGGPHAVATKRPPGSLATGTGRWLKTSLAVVLILGLVAMTHARAVLWGNTHDQALVWARLNPASPRAQANAAQAEMAAGHPERAAKRLRQALATAPNEVQLAFNLLGAECQMGHVQATTLQTAEHALQTTRDPGSLLEHWFERALQESKHPACPEMDLTALGDLLAAASANSQLMSEAGRRQDIDHLQGRVALMEDKPHEALTDFNRALDQQVRASAALQQAALLGAAGFPDEALSHLDHYEAVRAQDARPGAGMQRIHARVLEHQHYWDRELTRLRNTLLADQRARNATSS